MDSLITLELHKNGETKADGNFLVEEEKIKTYSDLMNFAKNKYNEDLNSDISLHFFLGDHLYKMSGDDDYKTFLKTSKVNKVVQVHVENSKQKELRGKYSVLRPEDITKVSVQQFEVLDIDPIDKKVFENKIKGTFVIAYCDEDPAIKDPVREDVELYKEIARSLGFTDENILTIENPTREQLLFFFDDIKEKHISDECFIFVFSGHGNIEEQDSGWVGEYVVVKDKAKVKVQELVERLKKCNFSAEATKILFLDACRGRFDEVSNKYKDKHELSEETTTTNMENIVIAYSTIPNKCSYTGFYGGSHFTECLHEKICSEKSQTEFHQLLTEVNGFVSGQDHEYENKEKKSVEIYRQMSCFRSSLCKELFFR